VLVFGMPRAALEFAVDDVTRLLAAGRLTHSVAGTYALADVVGAHQAVERGARPGRVLLDLPVPRAESAWR
jgi:NADPH2:quinone reductase